MAALFWGLCVGFNVLAGLAFLNLDALGALVSEELLGALFGAWCAALLLFALAYWALRHAHARARRRARQAVVDTHGPAFADRGVELTYAEGFYVDNLSGDVVDGGEGFDQRQGLDDAVPWRAFLLRMSPTWAPPHPETLPALITNASGHSSVGWLAQWLPWPFHSTDRTVQADEIVSPQGVQGGEPLPPAVYRDDDNSHRRPRRKSKHVFFNVGGSRRLGQQSGSSGSEVQ